MKYELKYTVGKFSFSKKFNDYKSLKDFKSEIRRQDPTSKIKIIPLGGKDA